MIRYKLVWDAYLPFQYYQHAVHHWLKRVPRLLRCPLPDYDVVSVVYNLNDCIESYIEAVKRTAVEGVIPTTKLVGCEVLGDYNCVVDAVCQRYIASPLEAKEIYEELLKQMRSTQEILLEYSPFLMGMPTSDKRVVPFSPERPFKFYLDVALDWIRKVLAKLVNCLLSSKRVVSLVYKLNDHIKLYVDAIKNSAVKGVTKLVDVTVIREYKSVVDYVCERHLECPFEEKEMFDDLLKHIKATQEMLVKYAPSWAEFLFRRPFEFYLDVVYDWLQRILGELQDEEQQLSSDCVVSCVHRLNDHMRSYVDAIQRSANGGVIPETNMIKITVLEMYDKLVNFMCDRFACCLLDETQMFEDLLREMRVVHEMMIKYLPNHMVTAKSSDPNWDFLTCCPLSKLSSCKPFYLEQSDDMSLEDEHFFEME